MAPPQTRPPRRFSPLSLVFWLTLAPLLGLLFWLALRACALTWPGGAPVFFFCPAEAAADPRAALLEQERIRGLTLEDRLERLRLALANAPACAAPPEPPAEELPPEEVAILPEEPAEVVPDGPDGGGTPVAEPPPEEARPPEQETVPDAAPPVEPPPDPAEEEERTPPEPEPVPEPPPPPPPPETTPPDRPETPPDAEDADLPLEEEDFEDEDLSSLEGCWNLASDYTITNPDTGESAQTESWQMCFDSDGRGTQTLEFENGLTCEGRVQAQFEPDGSLRIIDLGNVPCENGLVIVQRVVECSRQPDGSVDCETRHVTPPAFPAPVRFER